MSIPEELAGRHTPEDVARGVLREHPEFAEPHLLEDDETVPPRPEEDAADASRAE